MTGEVIVAGWMEYGGNRDRVLPAFVEVARLSRAENGCLAYEPSADPAAEGRIRIFERWRSRTELAVHLKAEHVVRFRESISPYPRLDSALLVFDVAGHEDFVATVAALS